ncbi:PD-(D/E)XK nuclease family protein [Hymenobacter sp. BT635]|uniref:PD-(D/E)XK nuclease family protein n=1 Tax=Hymenobacter nitidus TaxID=2880929 RepID=A0ABS8AJ38_9BACT|nr:PD-(D/E)XK nuclease family protein [Hymenobacter nitidus]MCB2380357.1 PD-(D/E)XK nuclease family protein [Hymenobacter nitidus]
MVLSPSQFSQVQECGYRFVLKLQGAAALPAGSAAALGNVLHRLMQEHVGRPFTDAEAFEEAWQRQVAYQELLLSTSVLSAALVPLARTAHGYAVKKAILRHSLLNPSQPQARWSAKAGTSKSYLGAEVKLGGAGPVAGRADLIRAASGGPELVDYKSGRFTADQLDKDGQVVAKPEYVQQLHLYAALYYEEAGHWPSRLLLAGLDGTELEVPFLPAECLTLLATARSMATALEAAARTGDGAQLARPAPAVCRRCAYRPHCTPYLALVAAEGGCLGSDVSGVISAIVHRGNRLVLTLSTGTGSISVQAIGATAGRLHQDAAMVMGAKIIIFGVHPTPVNRTFTAEPTAAVAHL